jgi:hypothetical protein
MANKRAVEWTHVIMKTLTSGRGKFNVLPCRINERHLNLTKGAAFVTPLASFRESL